MLSTACKRGDGLKNQTSFDDVSVTENAILKSSNAIFLRPLYAVIVDETVPYLLTLSLLMPFVCVCERPSCNFIVAGFHIVTQAITTHTWMASSNCLYGG